VSGVPIGARGLVDPAGIPGDDLDLATVSAAAGTISTGGDAMKTVADDIPVQWQGLAAVYEAPESQQVLRVMDPVATDVQTIGTAVRKVAKALDTYASAAAAPKKALDELRVEAAAFVARVQGGVPKAESPYSVHDEPQVDGSWNAYGATKPDRPSGPTMVPWYEDPVTSSENEQLIRRINEQVVLLETAQADCADAIKKAAGVSLKGAFVPPTEDDLNAHGVDLAWTRVGTAEGKTCGEQFSQGATNEFVSSVEGMTHMLGFDNQGDWSWGNLGSTWSGISMLGLAMTPYGWLDAWGDPKGQSAKTINGLEQGMAAWAGEAAEHPAAAAGAGVVGLGLGLGGPEMLGTKASRAAEFAEGATKLGGGAVAGDVARWLERGARQDHIDDLAAKFDQTFAEYMTTHEVADPGKPFEDPAFRDMWDGAAEDYRQTHPGFRFLEDGGLDGAEADGGHTKDVHLREGASGPALDQELHGRFEGENPHSVFTVSHVEVEQAMARTLDEGHSKIDDWLELKRNGMKKRSMTEVELPMGKVLGRGYDPDIGYFDGETMHVVVKYDPDRPAGYFVYTAYPVP
jgi:hypothetical protein